MKLRSESRERGTRTTLAALATLVAASGPGVPLLMGCSEPLSIGGNENGPGDGSGNTVGRGGQDGRGPGDQGRGGMTVADPPYAGICASAYPSRQHQPVLAAIAGNQVVLFDGDGARRVIHTFDGSLGQVSVQRVGRHLAFLGSRQGTRADGVGAPVRPLEFRLFDEAGNPEWQYGRLLGENGGVYSVFADDTGAVVLGAVNMPSIVRMPAGDVHELPDRWALAVPDGAGWVPASVTTQVQQYGFANAVTGAWKPLALHRGGSAVASGLREAVLKTDRFLYLAADSDKVQLVEESVADLRAFPLDVANDGRTNMLAAGPAMLVLRAGVPIALWRPGTAGLIRYQIALDGAGPAAGIAQTIVGAVVALVTRDGKPSFVLDLASGGMRPIDRGGDPATWGPAGTVSVSENGRYFLGSNDWADSANGFLPRWWVDAATATAAVVDLTRLQPLRAFARAQYCSGMPEILDDGRVAMGLRDDSTGGLFVGDIHDADWTRIGQPVTGVMAAQHQRIGSTWIVNGATLNDSYCPHVTVEEMRAMWKEPGNDAQVLAGDSSQIVPADGPVMVNDQKNWIGTFHPSGLCALDQKGNALDFRASSTHALGQLRSMLWLGDR